MEPPDNFGVRDLTGASFQHLLAAAGDGHQTAFAGSLGFKIKILKQGRKLSCQKVLERDSGAVSGIIGRRKACIFMRRLEGDAKGSPCTWSIESIKLPN